MRTFLLTRFCFLMAAVMLTVASCKKDKVEPPASSSSSTTISGIVVDEQNQPIGGVSIKAHGQTVSTDQNGFFTLEKLEIPGERCYVISAKSGYFEHAAAATPVKDGVTALKIKMIPHTYYSFSASAASTVILSGGSSVEFPAEGVVKLDGSAYNGTVKAAIRHIDPTEPGFSEIIIGSDLQAVREDGSNASLYSYGMMAVELYTENGQALQLAPGKKAKLTVSIPASMQSTAPSSIPLWFFDNATGLWKEEGSAVKSGNAYVGEVAHFTSWNLDKPENVARVKGKVVGCDLLPVPGVVVHVGQVTAITAIDGTFETNVMANEQFMIYIDPAENMGLFGNAGKTVGPFAAQQTYDVGAFDVACVARISGLLTDCDDKPMAGHIFITWGTNNYTYAYTPTGAFLMPVADNQPITINIQGANGKFTSISMQSPVSPLVASLDTVKVCSGGSGAAPDNYFVLNGGPYTNDTTEFFCGGVDSCGASHWSNSYNIYLFNKVNSFDRNIYIYVEDQVGAHSWTDSMSVFGNDGGYNFYGMNGTTTITSPLPSVGGLVTGEFTGVVGTSGSTSPVSINGKFKVIRRN